MRIGVFGGSYDPPHIAHLLAAFYCLSLAELDEVWFVPCFKHPFGKELSPFEDRFAMLELLSERYRDFLRVSDIERRLGETSYTLRTLKELRRESPQHQFILLAGSDVLEEKDDWKGFDEIERLVEIFEIPRKAEDGEGKHFYLPDISSTEIRERVRSGLPIRGMVTRPIETYVLEHRLYRQESS